MRKQFTFYESFFSALRRIKKDADRAKAYDAICLYALTGETPDIDALPDAAAIAFELIRPTLDSSAKKSESGKQGGSKPQANSKQTESKPQANSKRGETRSEKENEKEKEKEIEVEDECLLQDDALAKVFSYFLDRVDPMPSSSCTGDLKAYTQSMGADVVIHACEVARDQKGVQAGWSYIRGILRSYAQSKVTSMEDVLRLEQAHQAKKGGAVSEREDWKTDIDYLEELLAKVESEEGVS